MSMSLKTVLLTTDTTHHCYYAWKLNERFPLEAIFLETQDLTAKFDAFHPYEKLREDYERDVLLSGFTATFADLSKTYYFESVNDGESMSILKAISPDVMIVFGTGKLLSAVIQTVSVACLNLHGGNPEKYRGLDTHLWAIYHQDFDNLVTTLHYVDTHLDTGDIILQSQLRLVKGCQLYELRSINTKVCVDLSALALSSLQATGWVPSRKQLSRGRYYSFMPSVF